MKKLLVLLSIISISLPTFAINEVNNEVLKAEARYQRNQTGRAVSQRAVQGRSRAAGADLLPVRQRRVEHEAGGQFGGVCTEQGVERNQDRAKSPAAHHEDGEHRGGTQWSAYDGGRRKEAVQHPEAGLPEMRAEHSGHQDSEHPVRGLHGADDGNTL